ncbi:MAG: prenyltransferase [Gammaproteobacteria bacterium]|nr:prenyltransferase [Gammaproteobacteria bacterium]
MSGIRTHWFEALNPPIYLVSVLPGLAVPLLAGGMPAHALGLALATFAVVLLQHAINLFNDAADWRLGADVDKQDSWVRVHAGRVRPVIVHAVISMLLGGLLGLSVLWLQGQWWIVPIALPLLVLGYLYNAGPRPLSYTHFGEWVTGVCYGPGVFGGLWLVAGQPLDTRLVAGALAFAALAMALLLSHQPPQIETDRAAGKHSFAVRYGAQATRRAAFMLFLLFVAATLAGSALLLAWPWFALLSAIAVPIVLRLSPGMVNPKRILVAASALIGAGLSFTLLSQH